MKQEDKELLLRYLCMALPYGVILDYSFIADKQRIHTKKPLAYRNIGTVALDEWHTNEEIFKPYLRPLSSMTEEELVELNCLCYHNISIQDDSLCGYICGVEIVDVQDFLLRYHFDFMELIPRGLAIAVTEENNPYNMEV